MIYYSFPDIQKGYHISKQTLKQKCFSGELQYQKLQWSRENPNFFKYIIPESELPKLQKYKFAELEFNPHSQPDYYVNYWQKQEIVQAEFAIRHNAGNKNIYYEYLQTPEWKQKRFQRLRIDNFQCQLCGTGKNLEVHHINYHTLGNEDLDDLVTLCDDCHVSVHKKDLMNE